MLNRFLERHENPNTLKKIEMIYSIYLTSFELVENRTVYFTDEMTGIQALERNYEDMPVKLGSPALHEFQSIRHGTKNLIVFLHTMDVIYMHHT